ncbi:OsmC family protein [Actinoplanes sp. NPDC051411]|uniref:OsmC family protein n=1 Tax=Actinoplanes sp. NPDC051411 TaxID=3155522 RepID=UPI003434280E
MAALRVQRVGDHDFVGRNDRGATVRIGRGGLPGSFSPGELLQVATAACTAVTVEQLVTRRVGDDAELVALAEATRGPDGREYDLIRVTLRADLSFLDDEARERVVSAMRKAVERECKVSRTVERGARVDLVIDPAENAAEDR